MQFGFNLLWTNEGVKLIFLDQCEVKLREVAGYLLTKSWRGSTVQVPCKGPACPLQIQLEVHLGPPICWGQLNGINRTLEFGRQL